MESWTSQSSGEDHGNSGNLCKAIATRTNRVIIVRQIIIKNHFHPEGLRPRSWGYNPRNISSDRSNSNTYTHTHTHTHTQAHTHTHIHTQRGDKDGPNRWNEIYRQRNTLGRVVAPCWFTTCSIKNGTSAQLQWIKSIWWNVTIGQSW